MPYYRRYRKSYTKNSYRKKRFYRKKRSFSRFNLYRNRSAKAQSYQIYRLNKKVNHIYKVNKPEIQIYEPPTSHIIDPVVNTDTLYGRRFQIFDVVSHTLGIFRGRYARLKDLTLSGSFTFDGNPSSGPSTTTGCLRLIFFRSKRQIYPPPIIGDVLDDVQTSFSNEYYMRCPLIRGFSTKFTLLRDYKFYLRPGEFYKPKFIKLKIKLPFSLRRDRPLENLDGQDSNHDYPTNSIFCLAYICRAGRYTGSSLDTYSAELNMKLAYIDDNYTPTSE